MNRIKEIRMSLGMRQLDIAQQLQVKQNTLSYWESGRYQPDFDSLRKLAEIFGCTVDYILGTSDSADAAPESDYVRVPVLGSIPAGIPIEAVENVIDYEDIPRAMTCGGRQYFALQVKGDSMYPDYLPGDTVIVRKDAAFENGDVCVVFVNGSEATLKAVHLNDDGSLSLIPRNPGYAPRTYSPSEVSSLPVSVAGVVVELRRKIRK